MEIEYEDGLAAEIVERPLAGIERA